MSIHECFITILHLFALVTFRYYVFIICDPYVDLVPLRGLVGWPIINLIFVINIESSHFEFHISCPCLFWRPSEIYTECVPQKRYIPCVKAVVTVASQLPVDVALGCTRSTWLAVIPSLCKDSYELAAVSACCTVRCLASVLLPVCLSVCVILFWSLPS
jgi:hypothetical protein